MLLHYWELMTGYGWISTIILGDSAVFLFFFFLEGSNLFPHCFPSHLLPWLGENDDSAVRFLSPEAVGARILWKHGLRNPMEIILSNRKLQGWWLRFSLALVWMTENCPWQPVIHTPVTHHFSFDIISKTALRNTACDSRPWAFFRASFAASLVTDWLLFSESFLFILVQFPFLFQLFQTHSHVPSGEWIW